MSVFINKENGDLLVKNQDVLPCSVSDPYVSYDFDADPDPGIRFRDDGSGFGSGSGSGSDLKSNNFQFISS